MTSKSRAHWRAEYAGLDLTAAGGPVAPLRVFDLDGTTWTQAASVPVEPDNAGPTPILIGVTTAPLPSEAVPVVEQLTVTLGGGLAPYCAGTAEDLDAIIATVDAAPYAALTLGGVLRTTSRATLTDGLLIESLAYSMLLGAPEFTAWRARVVPRARAVSGEPVLLDRDGGTLRVTLNRPDRHNAFGRAVRDGLLDALELATLDPSVSEVVVAGAGPSFCSGGDLDEFGTAPDIATAHLVRLHQSAGRAVAALGDRIRFELHGACIGAGVEVPSFAPHVAAQDDAYFRLPELGMGLIPGAGGTVSIARRIGRWRTAYLALTNRAIDVATALEWGLVDARV